MNKNTTDRFWEKIEKGASCWLWVGYIDTEGYGRFQSGYAHRYSYELTTSASIDGNQVDHVCHVRACVNPAHLRLVTNKQNGENRRGPNSNNTSGVRGVNWAARNSKWRAQFRHNGKSVYVGLYETVEDAEAAVIAKRGEVFKHSTRDHAA